LETRRARASRGIPPPVAGDPRARGWSPAGTRVLSTSRARGICDAGAPMAESRARVRARHGRVVEDAQPDAGEMICRRSFVSGRVQGCFYGATCVRKAESLGLRGYARNLADGRVEVLACGEPAVVEEFVGWLWEGSPASQVTGVDTVAADVADGQRP